MSTSAEKINKYLGMNAIKMRPISSLPERKGPSSYKVSDEELYENVFHWDPYLRQFIRTKR